jgi:vacuolar-type H+-ATPase subunit H
LRNAQREEYQAIAAARNEAQQQVTQARNDASRRRDQAVHAAQAQVSAEQDRWVS